MGASIPIINGSQVSQANPVPSAGAANISGGASTYSAWGFTGGSALISNAAVTVKSSAGNLYSIHTAKNTNSNDCYILLYNVAAASVTVGTTVPIAVLPVPSGGYWDKEYPGEMKISFSTAISVAVVMTTVTGNTAPTTSFGIDILYK